MRRRQVWRALHSLRLSSRLEVATRLSSEWGTTREKGPKGSTGPLAPSDVQQSVTKMELCDDNLQFSQQGCRRLFKKVAEDHGSINREVAITRLNDFNSSL